MDEFKEKLIHLLHKPDITWNAVYQILKKDPSLQSLHYNSQRFEQTSLFTPYKALSSHTSLLPKTDFIHEQIRQYESNNIRVISIYDQEYPLPLKQIYQPPWALFVKGNVSLLNKDPKLAVVGTRQATPYGKNAIRLIFPGLIEKGVTIVSGLAKGIDTIAHEAAINNGGYTIGVIAGGFYHIYPKENKGLAEEMMKNHLLISEYPPDTLPVKWHFPARNRIISGISAGTFIVEAKRKSGSLITANYAVNEGREVFSLPGSIFNPFSVGTNELIQYGAKLVTCADDILVELRL